MRYFPIHGFDRSQLQLSVYCVYQSQFNASSKNGITISLLADRHQPPIGQPQGP